MGDLFAEKIWGVPWSILVVAALIIAVIYVVIDTGSGASGVRWFIQRWFHSLCWVLLAAAALSRTKLTPLPPEWAAPFAIAGGVAYVVFVVTWITRPVS